MESLDEPPSQYLLAALLTPQAWFFISSSIALVVLLITSALISGSEVAFFSLTSKDIANCKERGSTADIKLLSLIQRPKLLLATILIVNNFVNVAIVTLATFMTWEITGSKTTEGLVVALLTFVVTFVIVFFGEVLPKVYATPNNLQFARLTSPLIKVAETIFKPLSFLLMSMSNLIDKRFQRKGYDISVEELHHALEITTTNEETTEEEKDILKGIVNFGTLSVKQVMRSRMDITAFDDEMDFHELMDKINKSGFSRIPVYNETIDNIKGILYIKDLLSYVDRDENFEWQQFLRQGYFVPETKKIDSLLKDFQERRVHMAIVVDEYGGTSGLITLEDIIEEIVGEINDEFDDEDVIYSQIDERTYMFEGKTTLNDFCKVLEESPLTFEKIKGESESLGGLLLEINGKLPSAGERMYVDKYVFTVVAVDQRRIKKVRVFLQEEKKTHEN
ncbi:gliding motility-associated protein GldE [Fulvivirga sedimenti]|uniref:Gliding motility-associated protein GldE n=1 Tax=Fulvivirga sedimenti TaxID=2879465 RepID=A0A9X1HY65_9BACT|nr:gliding motility-associated protein GldE [Fulvivirga sedimenti]MCA6078614.1 gliding motility-associated protein GldE [Fulvivirga sedimenti]